MSTDYSEGKCVAKTATTGQLCKHKARPGSDLCGIHKNYEKPATFSSQWFPDHRLREKDTQTFHGFGGLPTELQMKIWDYAGSPHDGRTNLIHLYGLGTAPNVLRGRLILHYREEGHVLTYSPAGKMALSTDNVATCSPPAAYLAE